MTKHEHAPEVVEEVMAELQRASLGNGKILAGCNLTKLEIRQLARAALNAPGHQELVDALEPFADFVSGPAGKTLPDDMPLTKGSGIARKQLTVADFRRAATAFAKAKGVSRAIACATASMR